MEEFNNDFSLLESIPHKRNQKIIRKLENTDINEKKLLITSLINDWQLDKSSFNLTELKREEQGKRHRKKTIEEIGLLEYFLVQDPEWSK